MPKELTPEEKAKIEARKAAREKLKTDPKYADIRETVRFTMEDIIEEMAEQEPPADDESPFDYLARKIRGG
ncbi:MAG: hypothetical protein KGJ13_13030 [Patescibacteria group bacterium]|nr:hypothetical protein [Patescibacteria group bacterium]